MSNIISLNEISLVDEDRLVQITGQLCVMKYVGDGLIWSRGKVKKFIEDNVYEAKLSYDKRTSFFYKIEIKTDIIGIIGVHKYNLEKTYNLTIFIDQNYIHQGYGSVAIKEIIKLLHLNSPQIKCIYSDTLAYNIAAQKSMTKIGFYFVSEVYHFKKKYFRYCYNL